MRFSDEQQKQHREVFITECRQKAWSAACHSAWISATLEQLMASYEKLEAKEQAVAASLKELKNALDSHTDENRAKRALLSDRRSQIANEMKSIHENAALGQKSMVQLLQSAESALALAAHAEAWSWKEAGEVIEEPSQARQSPPPMRSP